MISVFVSRPRRVSRCDALGSLARFLAELASPLIILSLVADVGDIASHNLPVFALREPEMIPP